MVQTSDKPTKHLPGVHRENAVPTPQALFLTGVPVFLGFTKLSTDQDQNPLLGPPQKLTLWPQFQSYFAGLQDSYLAAVVHGFFANGGRLCYVLLLDNPSLFEQALQQLESLDAIDLVCAPDIMQLADPLQKQQMQIKLLEHCWRMGDRFAILDAVAEPIDKIVEQQQYLTQQTEQLASGAASYGALYAPWIQGLSKFSSSQKPVPPCGHIAGIYAQSDRITGVHKAPANYVLEDVADLIPNLSSADQQKLNPEARGTGTNCIRAFSGRGIRVWGAATLSQNADWHYVSVRRLFLTVNRWIDQNLIDVAFEPNDFQLWNRIERELTTYLESLRQQGALQGATPQESFYVKCNSETNPIEQRELGTVVTEIGLAPTIPSEFIVVRLIHGSTGVATL